MNQMNQMNQMQKIVKWEKAWGAYVKALAKCDDAREIEDGRAKAGARYSLRVACRKLRATCEEIGETLPAHWVMS